MKVVSVQTVRFAKLVESYGQPFSKTLWANPESDKELKKAVQQNRVLTVVQSNVGTKKDIGIIGFFPEKRGAFLLFPKPLGYAKGTKVIGIKWDLITEAPARDPLNWKTLPKPKARKSIQAVVPFPEMRDEEESRKTISAPPILPKRFEVVMEFRAKIKVTRNVEAPSKKAARQIAQSEKNPVDWSRAEVASSIKQVREI